MTAIGTGDATAGGLSQHERLVAVCARLSEPRPVDQIMDDLLEETRRLVSADAGTVLLVERDRLRFVCAQSDSRPDLRVAPHTRFEGDAAVLDERRPELNERSLAGYVAVHAETLRLDDAHEIPATAPYAFDPTYDQRTGYRTRSMLVIPLGYRGRTPIGVLQCINRTGANNGVLPFTPEDEQLASALASMATLSIQNAQLLNKVKTVHHDMIIRLAQAAEFRDNETGAHIQRVSLYSELVARTMGLEHTRCQDILFAAPMHDVGKLGVPDEILKKPGRLTDAERAAMQRHTLIGGQILEGSDDVLIRTAERIALTHHERWDGQGYPRGLSGDRIPVEGRIVAVADVFDALSSARCYKPAMTIDDAFAQIARDRGLHFDPEVVDAFLSARDTIEQVYMAYQDRPV
ncbi:MAG: HD domain-containing phosphohydrolase [Planctomycetota bacterium]